MADKSVKKAGVPGLKRTTSSARQPTNAVPMPERVLKKRSKRDVSKKVQGVDRRPSETWRAEVIKVSTCDAASYDNGRGLQPVHVWDENDKARRCALVCKGNLQGLTFRAEVLRKFQDDNPDQIFEFELPSNDSLLDIRLYESSRSLEIRWKLKADISSKIDNSNVWAFSFRTEDKHLAEFKAMMKRLASIISQMPEEWFFYRNFNISGPLKDKAISGSTSSTFVQEITGGHRWQFTGFLASAEFQVAIGRQMKQAAEEEEIQVEAEIAGVPEIMTQNKKKAAKKQARQQRRRDRRLRTLESSQETPGVGNDSVGHGEASDSPEAANQPSGADQEYVVEKLLDVRRQDAQTQFEVKWEGYNEPTWEPASNMPLDSIAQFYQGLFAATSQSASGRGARGGRRGRGGRARGRKSRGG